MQQIPFHNLRNGRCTFCAFPSPQICNKIHPVLKILLFQHHAGPQALIQFSSAEEADEVKQVIQSQTYPVHGDSLTFEVQFSKLPDLHVSQNSKFSWDFTRTPSPAAPQALTNPYDKATDEK